MKSNKIVIDPITRIEGHLRAEVEIDEDGVVTEAYVSGQLFRGIEMILKGRDPRDAGLLAGRICGVCTNSHFRGAVSCVEDAYSIAIPQNARLIRDLLSLTLFIQDHVVHFYHLHLLDFVDVSSALRADPKATAEESYRFTQTPFGNSPLVYQEALEKLQRFVASGRLGPFASSYDGHKALMLTPEQNLLLLSHYLDALKFQTQLSKAIAILGAKTPHPQTLVVGGITSVADMLNPQRLNDFLFILKEARTFVERAYLPDMKLLCEAYQDEMKAGVGRTGGNFLSCGGYPFDETTMLFESGVIYEDDFETIVPFDPSCIVEGDERAWYEGDEICYTDLNLDGTLKTAQNHDKYSWIKAPRYNGKSMETGPLARLLISYKKDNRLIKPFVDEFLADTKLSLIDLSSSIGRDAARAIETLYLSEAVFHLVSLLIQNIKYYDTATATSYHFETLPKESTGIAFLEVPRGMLSHFVEIKEGLISRYWVIAPTTWNASPKSLDLTRGAYEEALIGIKLSDPSRPIEVLQTLHSFDPCLACAVHIIDTKGRALGRYKMKRI